MVIIPIEDNTLPLIAAINGGVEPKVEEEHSSFIYHGEDVPNEIVPTGMVELMLTGGSFDILTARVIVKK